MGFAVSVTKAALKPKQTKAEIKRLFQFSNVLYNTIFRGVQKEAFQLLSVIKEVSY